MSQTDWRAWYADRRVLVIGASGFLGRHVSRALASCGARLMLSSTTEHSFPYLLPPSARAARLVCDVRDPASVARAVRDQEVVFNFAGRSGSVTSIREPIQDATINLLGALTVLEAVRQHAPEAKVVFPGSRLQYGRAERLPVPEDAAQQPITPYGVHKLAAEQHHLNYGRVFGVRATVLRITIPFGPHAAPAGRDSGVANRFIELALADRPLPVYGDGAQLRDYVYIDDVVEALALVGASGASDGRVYNVGGGRGIALVEFARLVIGAAGAGSVQRLPWPELASAVETGDFVADVSRIRTELGWVPHTSAESGVCRAIEELRQGWGAEATC